MRLVKYLSPDSVLLNLEIDNKDTLFRMMGTALAGSKAAKANGLDAAAIIAAVTAREAESTTGIGNGFAFPHARFSDLNSIAIAIATLKNPIDYGSFDHEPVTVACMVIVPAQKPTLALKVMSLVAKVFSDRKHGDRIRTAKSGAEVLQIMTDSEIDLDISITAADIMREPLLTFKADLPLKEATWQMAQKRINFVPVLDDDGNIIGEVSCLKLFKFGVPDFFSQLKSVSFICDFDPFEKYFFEEAHSRVGNVLEQDFCVMPPKATLMEIVFQLAVRNYAKIYVAEGRKLLGIIDQSTLMERIINI
ncbi:MAG: PTS sugar transporter subunit IIA [Victivallales bacterium]|nr:PTS sugar transporter subunit IIA [Victivallales bacterium]